MHTTYIWHGARVLFLNRLREGSAEKMKCKKYAVKTIRCRVYKFCQNINKKLIEKQKKLQDTLIFLIKFSLFAVVLHFLLWINIDTLPLQKTTAELVAFILSLIGYESVSQGTIVKTDSWGIEIVRDCLGWKSMLAVLGLVFATPNVEVRRKLLGALFGISIVFIANIARLVTTAIVGVKFGYSGFEMTHLFLWRWGLMVVVLSGWWIWLERCKH
jgi:exosortase/archaeosortase family protein